MKNREYDPHTHVLIYLIQYTWRMEMTDMNKKRDRDREN